jgi:hypothetical protein
MKAQLFQADFKGGPLDGMTLSVEVGQIVLYSKEIKDGELVKHCYEFEGGEFVYKGLAEVTV